MKVLRFNDETEFTRTVCHVICSKLQSALNSEKPASLFLAGGSSPVPVYNELARDTSLDWDKVIVGMGDERWSPENHDIQNAIMIAETLYNNSSLKAANFYAVPQLEDPAESAEYYNNQIEKALGSRSADVVLLGMGPDGHTASLFPGFEIADSESSLFVSTPAPPIEPQVPRISCSYNFLENAANLIFITKSAGKEEMLNKVLDGDLSYPAARAAKNNNTEWYILD